MLSKPNEIERVKAALRLPATPAVVTSAVAALAEAAAEVGVANDAIRALSAKISPGLDAAERRNLDHEIASANSRADAARAAQMAAANLRDDARKAFGKYVAASLTDDIQAWQHAVDQRLAELDELLAIGQQLDADTKEARISIGAKAVAGSGHLRGLLRPIAGSFTAWSR